MNNKLISAIVAVTLLGQNPFSTSEVEFGFGLGDTKGEAVLTAVGAASSLSPSLRLHLTTTHSWRICLRQKNWHMANGEWQIKDSLRPRARREREGKAETTVAVHSLFKIIAGSGDEEKLGLTYSYLKLGRQREIEEFSTLLAQKIRENLGIDSSKDTADLIVVNLEWARINSATSLLVANVAKRLGLMYVPLQARFKSGKRVYDYPGLATLEERRRMISQDVEITNANVIKGKKVILIDDAVVTGTVLREASRLLTEAGAQEVEMYSVVHLDGLGNNAFELQVNRLALQKGGIAVLCAILNDPHSIYTTRLVKCAFECNRGVFHDLVSRLSVDAKFNLYIHAIAYFGSEVPDNLDVLAEKLNAENGLNFPNSAIFRSIRSEPFFEAITSILHGYHYLIPIAVAPSILKNLSYLLAKEGAIQPPEAQRIATTGAIGEETEVFEPLPGIRVTICSAEGISRGDYYTGILIGQMPRIQEAFRIRGKKVSHALDLGTGRGVLGICQGLIFSPHVAVVATDINPEAVRVARANALRNGLGDRFETRVGDVTVPLRLNERFDSVMFTLPQTVIPPEMALTIPKEQLLLIDGGGDGRRNIDLVINNINPFMSIGAGMYFSTASFIDVQTTLELLKKNGFGARVFHRERKYLDETIHTKASAAYIEAVLGYRFPEDDTGRKYFEIIIIEAIKIRDGYSISRRGIRGMVLETGSNLPLDQI